MILFSILAIILAIVAVIAFVLLIAGGTGFIVIFGDLIVCIAIIGLIMKAIINRKRKK